MTTEDFEGLADYLESRGWTECHQFEDVRRWIKSFTVFGVTNVHTFSVQVAINANPEHDLSLGEWLKDLTQRIPPEHHLAIAPIIERFGVRQGSEVQAKPSVAWFEGIPRYVESTEFGSIFKAHVAVEVREES